MRLLDEKGRFFGKVSLVDIFIVAVVLALGAGFIYQRTSGYVKQVVNSDTVFYIVFRGDQVRKFSVDAISEGDVIYRQHDTQPVGKVVRVETEPGTGVLIGTDGTASLSAMEDRYTLYITVECTGSVTGNGYFVNGYQQYSEGNNVTIQSNRLLILSVVHRVLETL